MAQWLVTHDSHIEKRGDTFEGDVLPWYLVGKTKPIAQPVFEVATPAIEPPAAPAKKPRAKKGA